MLLQDLYLGVYSTLQISMHFLDVHEAKWLILSFDSFHMKILNSSMYSHF